MWLDAVVSRLLRDLECELQGIARAQDDGVCAFLERNPVRICDLARVDGKRVRHVLL